MKRATHAGRTYLVVATLFVVAGLAPVAPAAAAPDPGCDYNGDGKADLAFGWAGFDSETGVVGVLYGSTGGLAGFEDWSRDTPGIKGTPAGYFGVALTCGDFDGDGNDELAVGSGHSTTSHGVNIIYGSAGGLTEIGDQLWSQNTEGIKGTAGDDGFGTSLAAGDFDGDGYADLAVGAPFDDTVRPNGGEVHVLYGSSEGLSARDQLWTQDSPDVKSQLIEGDLFGFSMTTGDFDDDGYADLVIGAYNAYVDGILGAGEVNVLYGGAAGLTATGDQHWHENSPGIKGTVQGESEHFGFALASGDFDDDGVRDLAVGEPGARLGIAEDVGEVHILFGRIGSGLGEAGDEFWTEDSPGVQGTATWGRALGYSLAAGDYDGNGITDLAIGVPSLDQGSSGGVHVLDGTDSGLTASGDQLIGQGSDGIKGVPSNYDALATSARSGDFNGDGKRDLAFGNCSDDDGGGFGSAQVIYGSAEGLSTSDQFFVPADFFVYGDEGGGFGDIGGREACL